jgi:hypothetical protein
VLRRNTAGSSWGPNPAVVPKPTDEANRSNLRHVTPKTFQNTLYVGFSHIGRPLQVVWFGWSQFPIPEAPLAGQARYQTPFTRHSLASFATPARRTPSCLTESSQDRIIPRWGMLCIGVVLREYLGTI